MMPMPKFRLSMTLLWMLGLFAVFLAWVGYGTTSAAFESSEGNWSDREMTQEGRDFRAVLTSFEEFRQACDRPDATMYRTTERNPLNILAWWNYAIDPKWKLPYRSPQLSRTPVSSCGP
jgi:hypothetical protein